MQYKGILFDFDGVVLKSMEQHFEAWRRVFADHDIEIDRTVFYRMEGQGILTIAHQLALHYGLASKSAEELMIQKVRTYYEEDKNEFYPYLKTLLQNLKKQNVPMAVVTGGNRERVAATLKEQLPGVFDALVSFDDVENGKPHPEPFLKGAQKLGLDAGRCLVLENAPLGIKAAKAAGCYVVAITTTLPQKELAGADDVVDSFEQAEEIIKNRLALR